jgi:hypothetical protein
LSATTNLVMRVSLEDHAFAMPDATLSNAVWQAAGQPADALTSVDLLNLPTLSLASLRVTNLNGLQWAWNLTNLSLGGNPINSLSPLSVLTNLNNLSLVGSSLTNLTSLQTLSNLTVLSLAYNNLNDISSLAGLTNLASLNLSGNALTNLSPLTNLTRLTTLNLYSNNLSDVSPLLGLTNLTSLDLGRNPIANFSPLSGLSNLLTLRLESDLVSNLTFAASLPRLTLLDLFDNQIAALQPLAGLTNLSQLSLDVNRLTAIGTLTNLASLSFVDVSLNILNVNTNSPTYALILGLINRGVQVIYLPNRTLSLTLPTSTWLIPPNRTSFTSIRTQDNGPTNDPVTVTFNSSNPTLLPNANVTVTPNTNASFYFGYFNLAVTPLTGQTGTTTLNLTATDSAGVAATQALQIVVAPPQPFDGSSLSGNNLSWVTWGSAPWFIQTNITHNGISAAQSGHIGDGLESWLQTSVVGPGSLTFWWKVSSEQNYDFLRSTTNGVQALTPISGEVDWTQHALSIPPGAQLVAWGYVKDPNNAAGLDAGWLSEVSFAPAAPWIEVGPAVTNGQVKLTLHGIVGHLYEVQSSTNLLNWSTLTIITLTNSPVIIYDSITNPGPRFYRLRDLSVGTLRLDSPSVSSNSVLLVLHSPTNLRFRLQASSNLTSWVTLATITNTTGMLPYKAPLVTNAPRQFYRALLLSNHRPLRQVKARLPGVLPVQTPGGQGFQNGLICARTGMQTADYNRPCGRLGGRNDRPFDSGSSIESAELWTLKKIRRINSLAPAALPVGLAHSCWASPSRVPAVGC